MKKKIFFVHSKDNISSGTSEKEAQSSIFKEGHWDYTWVTQHFSVQECPKIWQHPLSLAEEALQKQRFVKFDENEVKEEDSKTETLTAVKQGGDGLEEIQFLKLNEVDTRDRQTVNESGVTHSR